MIKRILIISIVYLAIILISTFNMDKGDNQYFIIISLLSAVFCILLLREIYKKDVEGFKLKKNDVSYVNSKNYNTENLKKISKRPFLFGLENKFVSENEFYFDKENFYAVNKEHQRATFKLADITEINKTAIKLNNRRLWQVTIKEQETREKVIFKFAHNYTIWNNNFKLFYEKVKGINPSAIKSKWNLW